LPRRRILVLAALALLAGLVALTARFILWPDTNEPPRRADAVVALYGGGGERLASARRLVERGIAPVLVVSHGAAATDLCGQKDPYEIVCFDPEPDRTQGEARAVADLARERGWRSIVVVTSDYHAVRARMLFRRCLDGRVEVVGARPDSLGGLPDVGQVVHEWVGYGAALVVDRGC
jgi:uncharacterized SAM-binding protein YcdF (DUF218 family)